MISVFKYANYRELLKDLLYGPDSKRGDQSELAKAMGCQASYLLQVLKEKAELTEDHVIRLAHHLNLGDLQTEYFLQLLRISRAATKDLIQFLEKRRADLMRQQSDLENKVESRPLLDSEQFLSRYFSSWIPSTIHVATSSEKFQSPSAIAERLSLPINIVEDTLNFLEEYSLIKRRGKDFLFASGSIHLPRRSALNEAHQSGRRIQVLRSIQQQNNESLHFSSVFTLDEKSFKELKHMMTQFIEGSHKKIHEAGTDEIYAMSMDLFQVV